MRSEKEKSAREALAKETAANMAAQQETVANWNRDGRSPEAWPLQRKQAAANGGAAAEGHTAQPGAARDEQRH